ncbi:MAG: hypothetical protein LBT38_06530 [Deltaproteobacteria bacterium]|jgi:DNA-directed RNA polymerase subunit RPC12/RpoP|nr:hypothetical protein [Deltaproteobacteria bacterium]
MKVPCSNCGSQNTEILPESLAISGQSWPAKVARELAKVFVALQPKQRIMGRRAVVCRDCGHKMVMFFD